MATAKADRSRQPHIRIVAKWRKEIDLDRLARAVLELAKQRVARAQTTNHQATIPSTARSISP